MTANRKLHLNSVTASELNTVVIKAQATREIQTRLIIIDKTLVSEAGWVQLHRSTENTDFSHKRSCRHH
jgi:hypothetical protein